MARSMSIPTSSPGPESRHCPALPSTAIPTGFRPDGLPVGMQIVVLAGGPDAPGQVGYGQRVAQLSKTEETIHMKAIVVTDQAAGTAGMKLVERPEPQAAINDVVVQVHASGFTWDELTWPSTWTDRLAPVRTPVIPAQALAGGVTALGSR